MREYNQNSLIRTILVFSFLLLITINSIFPQEEYALNVQEIIVLPMALYEISGMVPVDGYVYAINDSGNGNTIFKLNSSDFSIVERVKLQEAKNIDWEEISYYNGDLYIGDIGNNFGARKNLVIYKVPIEKLFEENQESTQIRFKYRKQDNYKIGIKSHPWDCESFIVGKGGIKLFSKNWLDLNPYLYNLNNEPGIQSIIAVDTLNIDFLITGAYYDTPKDIVFLCGYLKKKSFLVTISGFSGNSSDTRIEKFSIPDINNMQVESIFVDDNYIYLASERAAKSQRIFKLINPYKNE